MRILVDVDSTIADSLTRWLSWISEFEPYVHAKVSDIKHWDLLKCPPLAKLDRRLVYGILDRPGFTRNIPVMPGAQEAIQQMTDAGHELYFVTARVGVTAMAETFEWFEEHFPKVNLPSQLIFMSHKHLIPADVIIDDSPGVLTNYAQCFPDSTRIAISYPYNEHLFKTVQLYSGPGTLPWDSISCAVYTRSARFGSPQHLQRTASAGPPSGASPHAYKGQGDRRRSPATVEAT